MNPLLGTPTDTQRKLLEAIILGLNLAGEWPYFQWVESQLYAQGLDATTAILTCPIVTIGSGPGYYGWISASGSALSTLKPDDTIALTVAGLARLPSAEQYVQRFLAALSLLVEAERPISPHPREIQKPTIERVHMIRFLYERHHMASASSIADFILGQMEREPSTWHCVVQRDEERVWIMSLSPLVRRYAGVESVEDYIDRLFDQICGKVAETVVYPSSGLALPEAIDYLNSVWRVRADKPMFHIARAEAAAKLALECEGVDDFEARLSALAAILGHVDLPGERGTHLDDLESFLRVKLGSGAISRAETAIGTLKGVFDLRAWRQHPGTDQRGRRGMRRLGVELPTANWAGAWATVQARCVAALNALREEIEDADGDFRQP